jgi:outer membrane protein assembly factor BamA
MRACSSRTIHLAVIFSFSLLLFACSNFAHAQTNQAPLGEIIVEGASRLSSAQIAAASGLKVGQAAEAPALDAAADRLSETGAFSEVGYRFQTAGGKKTVTFHVVEEPKTVTCAFDNFVWFTLEEIERAVQAEVPLYDGRVPLDGNLSQTVAMALEHLLATRHIAATVGFIPAAEKIGSPPTQFLYSAKGNNPEIAAVEYLGGPLDPSTFSIATTRLLGHPFSRAYSRSLAKNDLDVIYRNHGYLQARFAEAVPTFTPGPNPDDPGKVKVTFTVTPGVQYTWNGADWNGDLPYSAAELNQIFAIKSGEIAGADKISAGNEFVRAAYGKKGYINAVASSDQQFNDATAQVHMSFKIKEGDQYHMGTLTVTGANDRLSERIRNAWRLKAPEIYNASYKQDFRKQDLPVALKDLGFTTIPLRLSISEHPNPDSLTVDVLLTVE